MTSSATKIGPFTCRPHLRGGQLSGAWQIDIPARYATDGKRQRLSFKSRREAEIAAKRLLRSLEVQGMAKGVASPPSGITLTEVAKLWLDKQVVRVKARQKRAESLDKNAFQLKAVLAYLGSDDLERISAKRVLEYQQHRSALGRQPTTVNSETSTLRQVLRWAVESGLCRSVPKVVAIPARRRRLDLPSQTEVAQIIAHLPKPEGLIIRFFAETGCRKSEAFHLEWRDIDWDRGLIHIRSKEGFTPKTEYSERSIPVSASLLRDLKKARGMERLVFPGRGGVVRTDIEKALTKAIKASGVCRGEEPIKLTLHMLRKAHASWQAMLGLPESVLQVRLGHVPGSRVTQQIYIHAAREREPDGILALPVRRRARHVKK